MKRFLLFFFTLWLGLSLAGKEYRSIFLDKDSAGEDPVTERAAGIFQRVALEKSGGSISFGGRKGLLISLVKEASFPEEAFEISFRGRDRIILKASGGRGFLYGLGHILHRGRISDKGLDPAGCEGYSAPAKPVRGIYFATHFRNYYHEAPIGEISRYIEDLALWGYNALQVWFDMHHYDGIDDPEAAAMMDRLAAILLAGENVGMRSGLTMLSNEGYRTTPPELRAERITWTAHYGCEICPSTPGGTQLILKNRREFLREFSSRGVHVRNVWIWPYDQGGCSCPSCSPWGGNGYLTLSRPLSALLREELHGAEIVLSTWLLDFNGEDKGEWKALAERFGKEGPWVDAIMADSHGDFPPYLLSHPVPGGLPLENFPEISMWASVPWGGYGANPLPSRFERLYLQSKDLLRGGFPYSEGKFEDINKVIYSRFYWEDKTDGEAALREYAGFEFGKEYAGDICKAVSIMEKNHGLTSRSKILKEGPVGGRIQVPETDYGAKECFDILSGIDGKLPERVRSSWRWRILYLRAFLDWKLRESGGAITPEVNSAFRELTQIGSLENGDFVVRPLYFPEMEDIGESYSDSPSIQKAVNEAVAEGSGEVRLKAKEDGTPWIIGEAIRLPSGIRFIVDNCTMKLSDACRDNMFRSDNVGAGIENPTWNYDISIIGIGDAVLRGADNPRATGDGLRTLALDPAPNGVGHRSSYGSDAARAGEKQRSDWRNFMILMGYVDGLRIEGLRIEYAHGWAVTCEKVRHAKLRRLDFYCPQYRKVRGRTVHTFNNDGIDLREGCKYFDISDITGITGDDLIALSALDMGEKYHRNGDLESFQVTSCAHNGPEDDIEYVHISSVRTNYAAIALRASDSAQIHHVYINGVTVRKDPLVTTPYKGCPYTLKLGNRAYGSPGKDFTIHDIYASNLVGDGRRLIEVTSPVRDCYFSNAVYTGVVDEGPIWYSAEAKEKSVNVVESQLFHLPSATDDSVAPQLRKH